jgi:dTDP-4-amino-4,6-dideoxygalactose transaminase
LQREDRIVANRRRNAEYLNGRLRDIQGINLPESSPERPHAYTYYPVVLRHGSRFGLGTRLAQAGIETKWRYHPLHLQAGFQDVRRDDMQQTERLWAQHLLLPAGTATPETGLNYLADSLGRALS